MRRIMEIVGVLRGVSQIGNAVTLVVLAALLVWSVGAAVGIFAYMGINGK